MCIKQIASQTHFWQKFCDANSHNSVSDERKYNSRIEIYCLVLHPTQFEFRSLMNVHDKQNWSWDSSTSIWKRSMQNDLSWHCVHFVEIIRWTSMRKCHWPLDYFNAWRAAALHRAQCSSKFYHDENEDKQFQRLKCNSLGTWQSDNCLDQKIEYTSPSIFFESILILSLSLFV